jgi:peptidoglycan/LPS O-acetylase OafA/YrhL
VSILAPAQAAPARRRDPDTARVAELDAIRAIAALAVLATHLPLGFWFGETGVDLFFVLSGYLITTIIMRNHAEDGFLARFYGRRALRIFPIYYLTLIALVAINALRRHPASIEGLGFYATYTQNVPDYWGSSAGKMELALGHTWTLAIEEQFYLLWPSLLLLVRPRNLAWLALAFWGAPLLARGLGVPRTTLLGHTDGIALGALLAWWRLRPRERRSAREPAVFLAILLGAAAVYLALWMRGLTGKPLVFDSTAIATISVAYFALIGLVLASAGAGWLRPLRSPALCYLGQISYGIYLYHWPVYEHLDAVFNFGMRLGDPWWLSAIKVVVSVGVAALSWRYVERPLLAFKDRLAYTR